MKYIIIKSQDRHRQWGTISDANYDLHNLLEKTKRIELLSFTMFNGFLNITEENNKIYVAHRDDTEFGVVIAYTITLSIGMYDIDSFIAMLNTELNKHTGGVTVFIVTYNPTTYKITISEAPGYNIYINGTHPDSTILGVMGFENIGYSDAPSYTGTYPVNLNVIEEIYVHIYEFGVNFNAASSLCLSTFVIPVEVNSGELINYKSMAMFPQSISLDDKTLKNIRIVLKDKNGRVLDTNNQDFTMILGAQCSK